MSKNSNFQCVHYSIEENVWYMYSDYKNVPLCVSLSYNVWNIHELDFF